MAGARAARAVYCLVADVCQGRALAQNDLAMAGFDLAALAAGALFAAIALAVARRAPLSG